MEEAPEDPNESQHKFIHITRFTNAESIQANPGEVGSSIQRVYSHNAIKQLSLMVKLCKDYVHWDLHHTRDRHGDDKKGYVGYGLKTNHPLVTLNCVRAAASGSDDAHLCTIDAD